MKKIAGLVVAGFVLIGGVNFVSADEAVQQESNTNTNSNCIMNLTDEELAERGLTREECEALCGQGQGRGQCKGQGQGQGRGMGRGLGCKNSNTQQ